MIVWILVGLIGLSSGVSIEVGGTYRTEAACNAARDEVIAELPEGKPIVVGCVAQKLKAA